LFTVTVAPEALHTTPAPPGSNTTFPASRTFINLPSEEGQLSGTCLRVAAAVPLFVSGTVTFLAEVATAPGTTFGWLLDPDPICTAAVSLAVNVTVPCEGVTVAVLMAWRGQGTGTIRLVPSFEGELCCCGPVPPPNPDAPNAALLTTTV